MSKIFFVGGTGSNQLHALLGSHKNITMVSQALPLYRFIYPKYKKCWDRIDNNILVTRLLHSIYHEFNYQSLDFKPDYRTVEVGICDAFTNKEISSYAEMTGVVFGVFLEEYRRLSGLTDYCGLQTNHNEFFADEIFSSFPATHFFHAYSNIVSTIAFFRERDWLDHQEKNLLDFIIRWHKSLEIMHINFHHHPGQYIGINYDSVQIDPEAYAKIMCAFFEIPFDVEMVEFQKHPAYAIDYSCYGKLLNQVENSELTIISDISNMCMQHINDRNREFSLKSIEAEQLNWLGEQLLEKGDNDVAVMCFEKAMAVDILCDKAFLNVGDLYVQVGDYEQALFYYLSACHSVCKNRNAVEKSVTILMSLNNYVKALDVCKQYLQQCPEDKEMEAICETLRAKI